MCKKRFGGKTRRAADADYDVYEMTANNIFMLVDFTFKLKL
jgi:hypothetical protein